jgi:arginyl-tRNA--protein-N-Asp/Glu arginylyltransferase
MHITRLENKLKELYTIEFDGKSIDVRYKLDDLRSLENIYAVIETTERATGETYEQYKGYLDNVREDINSLQDKKKEIEQVNENEISNLNLMLKKFRGER